MSKPIIYGTAGDDLLTGTSGADLFALSQGGSDSASGLGGNDTFSMHGALDAGDQLDGGDGNDVVILDGDYSGGLTFAATTLTSIETLRLDAGFSYDLTSVDATVAAGAAMTVDGSRLGASDTLSFDGSAETDGQYHLVGGAGDDVLKGGSDGNTFDLTHGGDDTATGGAGNDDFNLGAALTAADSIDGGAGNDTVTLSGDYASGVTFGATTLVNIENLVLVGGHSYDLEPNIATVTSDATMLIDATELKAGDTFTFNGAQVWDGHFVIDAGSGTYDIIGSEQSDTFNFGRHFSASDFVRGHGSSDTLVLDGNYIGRNALVLNAGSSISYISTLKLGAGFNYHITTGEGAIDPDGTLAVDASGLDANNRLYLDGSGTGPLLVIGGAGVTEAFAGGSDDTFIAGSGINVFYGGLGEDQFTDGGTKDEFIYRKVAESCGTSYDTIHDLDFATAIFQVAHKVNGVDAAITTGTLDAGATFNSQVSQAIGPYGLGTRGAVLFTPDSGNLANHTFLVIDQNNAHGYQGNADLIIDVTGFSGSPIVADFI